MLFIVVYTANRTCKTSFFLPFFAAIFIKTLICH